METPASPHKPIIEVTALSRSFDRTRAIDQTTFDVQPGENLCVIGENGAGKSTLLYLLSGLLYPSSGHVKVFGLHRWKDSFTIRKQSIFLPDMPMVDPCPTPYEYLRLIAQIYRMPKSGFLRSVEELARQMNMIPHLGKEWNMLSFGMIKKTGLIGAFMPPVQLRILDEPFAGGIDPLATEQLMQWMGESRQRGETVIFSTQILEQAESVCDRILMLRCGSIEILGSPKELISLAGVDPTAPRALAKAFLKLSQKATQK